VAVCCTIRDEEWDMNRQKRERLAECAIDARLGQRTDKCSESLNENE
jgi:hypothetical protein